MRARLSTFFQYFFYLFIFLVPWQTSLMFRERTIGKQGSLFEGPWEYGKLALTALDIIFLCIVVSGIVWIFATFSRSELTDKVKILADDWANRCIVTFALFAWVSIFWSSDMHLAALSAFRLTEGVCMYAIARYAHYDHIRVATACIAAATIQGFLACWQFFTQEVIANKWLGMAHHSSQQLGDVVIENSEVRWLRAYGSFPHPNILGVFLIIGIFFLLYLVERINNKKMIWVLFMCNVCMVTGLFFTFSRSVWVSCAGALMFLNIVSRKKKDISENHSKKYQRMSAGTLFAISAMVAWVSLSLVCAEPLAARFGIGGWSRLEQKSTQERVWYIKDALQQIHSSWYKGIGIGQYTYEVFKYDMKQNISRPWYLYQPVHNVFLLVFAELGIIGLLLWLAMILILGKRAICILWERKRVDGVVYATGGIVLTMIGVAFVDHFFWTLQSGILLWWLGYGFFSRNISKT